MRPLSYLAGLSALVITGLALAAPPKPKIKPTVEFAHTWEAAVAEAKMLNLPLVVHNHGFY